MLLVRKKETNSQYVWQSVNRHFCVVTYAMVPVQNAVSIIIENVRRFVAKFLYVVISAQKIIVVIVELALNLAVLLVLIVFVITHATGNVIHALGNVTGFASITDV